MNSVKNLLVIVLLMGVSYGAYQVITTPEPEVGNEAKSIDELDIQIGSRIDDPMLMDSDTVGMDTSSPELPPLPPSFDPAQSTANQNLSAPELQVPELEVPQLNVPNQSSGNDPLALQAPGLQEENNHSAERLESTPMVGELHEATEPLVQNHDRSFVQDGGSFSPVAETELEPVTPKPPVSTPAEDMSRFVSEAKELAKENPAALAQGSIQPIPENSSFQVNPATTGQPLNRDATMASGDGGFTPALPPAADNPSAMAQAAPPVTNPAPATTAPVSIDWQGISQLANSGQATAALRQLSSHYDADLSEADRMQMQQWLDLLAGKVIYSTEHLLSPQPHVVQDNETLESIAQAWNVPAKLIYNVNQAKIGDPAMLVPGTELKVIQGPFNADVSLGRNELTLFLNGMYAGRFAIELGTDGQGIPHGSFMVEQKLPGRDYTGSDGQVIAAQTANNPYGQYWIGLNENVSIHESSPDQMDHRGSIRLGSRDAADVFGILSNGSQVTIRR